MTDSGSDCGAGAGALTTTTLDDLPPELLLMCLGRLPARDLARASRVSRRWRVLAGDDALWRSLYASDCIYSAIATGEEFFGFPLRLIDESEEDIRKKQEAQSRAHAAAQRAQWRIQMARAENFHGALAWSWKRMYERACGIDAIYDEAQRSLPREHRRRPWRRSLVPQRWKMDETLTVLDREARHLAMVIDDGPYVPAVLAERSDKCLSIVMRCRVLAARDYDAAAGVPPAVSALHDVVKTRRLDDDALL